MSATTRSRSTTHTTHTTQTSQSTVSPAMNHSFSRSWKSPAVVARERWIRILKARDHICPDSPYLTRIFDHVDHRRYLREAGDLFLARKQASTQQDAMLRAQHAVVAGRTAASLAPFDGRSFATNHGPVLGLPTVFTPSWYIGKDFVAPWPSMAEMKYEGDERISTGKENQRFLPVPRYPCGPGVDISFDKVDFLPQYQFDSVRCVPDVESVFFMAHVVGEVEIADREAEMLVGRDLLRELDPVTVYGLEA